MSRSESLPRGRRTLRWILWLGAGVLFGLLAGFVAALAANGPDTEFAQYADSPTRARGAGGGGR